MQNLKKGSHSAPLNRIAFYRCTQRYLALFFYLLGTATVRDSALVTNRLRLTPSRSALSTSAWCNDFGKRTVNLPLYLVKSPERLAARAGARLADLRVDLLAIRFFFIAMRLIPLLLYVVCHHLSAHYSTKKISLTDILYIS